MLKARALAITAPFFFVSSDQKTLQQILLRPDHPEVRLLDGSFRKIPARLALLMAKKARYEWCGSKHRVKKMRPIAPPPLPWVPCYRTTAAPALPPSIEWCRSRRTVLAGLA